jgi:hypothetical protein
MKTLLLTSVAALFLATGTAHAQVSNNYVPIPRPFPGSEKHYPAGCYTEYYRHGIRRLRCYDKLGHGRWMQPPRKRIPKRETLDDWMWCDDALSGDNGTPSETTKRECEAAAKRLGLQK